MSEEPAAPADEKENAVESPSAPPKSGNPPTSVVALGFVAAALLGVLIAITVGSRPGSSSGDEETLREMKANLQLRQEALAAERARLGLAPMFSEDKVESAETIASRITEDTATLVALSKGAKDIIADKDREIAERTKELQDAMKLQLALRDELAQAKKELDRALIESSGTEGLRAQLEAANRRIVALGDEVRRLSESSADTESFAAERSMLQARIRELENQLSQASLFAGTEEQMFQEAAELFRRLRELEDQPDAEIARAYSQFGANLGATMLDKVDFETGSASVQSVDQEKILKFASEAPENALLFVVGYASETGNVDQNRALSSNRATAVAKTLNAVKKSGQRVQAAYMGQTDRFGSRFPERNQICEVWQIVPKN